METVSAKIVTRVGHPPTSTGGTPLNLAPSYNSNGEIATIADSLDTGRTQSFTYDSLSRVTAGSSAATSGADCWGQTFTIDNVANLTSIALSKCSGGSFSAAANQNNQFTTGYTYDAAGNLTGDGLYTYAYNAENEITSANSVSYSYDGNRMRVAKSGGTMYWRDVSGNTIAETTLTGTDVNEYIFFAGRRVARIDASGNVYYYQADQIGSTRTGTNAAGTLCYDADFTPYGSEMAHTTTCAQNYKFAGYERDSETGLDYAVNRYYNSRIGRFMSADPSGIASARLTNPQTLHRYAYVLNNPLIGIDPWGLECVFMGNDGGSVEEVDPTDENDHSSGTDSASCLNDGGLYFEGNNEVNYDNYAQDGGNWGRFDLDADSNWVGLTDDNGNPLQASCTGGSCSYDALANMGSDYAWGLHGHWDTIGGPQPHVKFADVPWYRRKGCGQSLTETGIGALTSAAAGATVWFLGPEALELAGEGVEGMEAGMSYGHTVSAGLQVMAAPFTLLGHGAIGVSQNCF